MTVLSILKALNSLVLVLVFSLSQPHTAQAQDYETLFQDFHSTGLTRDDKRFLQAALAFEGHYNGLLDGAWGRLSQSALERFSWSRFGGASEEWHMAYLALSFFQLYERDGWQIEFFEPLGMSMLVPSDAVTFDPATDAFVNFRHTRGSLAYSIGVHTTAQTSNIHDYALGWHEKAEEPYTVRRKGFAVTSSARRDGSVLYARSNHVNGTWSTIMLSADRDDASMLNAVAASLAVGRSAPLTFSTGGRIDVAVTQTLDIIRNEEDHPPSHVQSGEQFLQVSSHGSKADAIARAETYQARFPNVAVYETQSGFFAVVLGLFASDRVLALISSLVAEGVIPNDSYPTAGARFTQKVWDRAINTGVPSATVPQSKVPQIVSTGTGFYVSSQGHVLTNEHVINGCTNLAVQGQDASIVAASVEFDLALLQVADADPEGIAVFSSSPARLNSDVTVVGFPLTQLLGGLNVTRGAVSSQKGFRGEITQMQITAPVQSGNSGGPVLGADGEVVGVVSSKLDAEAVTDDFGDTPQNVNFAIRGEIAKLFLAQNGVEPVLGTGDMPISPVELADNAKLFTVFVECSQ